MGLSFVYATGPCQRSLSRVRVPWDSRPYFTVPDLRLPFSSPPATRRVTVEVFDPYSTRIYSVWRRPEYRSPSRTVRVILFICCPGNVLTEPLPNKRIIPCLFVTSGTCLPNSWLAMDFRSGSAIPAFRRHVTIYYHKSYHVPILNGGNEAPMSQVAQPPCYWKESKIEKIGTFPFVRICVI
jgi:hypothetical protein